MIDMKCSECERHIEADRLPGRHSNITYLFDFPMGSEIAKQVGDDWVGVIYDGKAYCRACLPKWRVLGAIKKG